MNQTTSYKIKAKLNFSTDPKSLEKDNDALHIQQGNKLSL